jgi:hypothetical protein
LKIHPKGPAISAGTGEEVTEAEPQYIKVHTLSNRFEADVITEALEQEGIPVLLRSFVETPYSGLFVPQRGWGRIMVPKQMADRARAIISDLAEKDEPGGGPLAESTRIEPGLWDSLRRADPQEIASRTLVDYEQAENVYTVPFLNTAVLCYPETEEIEALGNLADLSADVCLSVVVLHYLLYSRNKPLANKWVGVKDLPSGSLFFTASHALPSEALCEAFDAGPDLLDEAAQSLGGERTGLEALSYRFGILPRTPILIIFHARDEEFEPSFQILFDETIMDRLGSLDLVWGLVNVFARALLDSTPPLPGSE